MLTATAFDLLIVPTNDLYEQYMQSVINDISRRLSKLDMTATAAWQMQRLIESGKVYENALEELSWLTGRSEAELRIAFEKAGVKSLKFDDAIYREAGLTPVSLNLSPAMADVLAMGLRKTGDIMRNLTMTTAIDAEQKFTNAADIAYLQVSTGTMSYDEAIRSAVKDIASQGLSTIDYISGRHDQLDVAMRRTVLTGVAQTTGRLQTARADEMGCDLVQTSAHAGARPTHEVWQGKVFSRSGTNPNYPDFVTEIGYGEVDGLCGINCILGDTKVSGAVVNAFDRREYSGEIIIVHTAGGKELSVTPNHPILTSQGWVNAGLLIDGDYIICRRIGNGATNTSPNNDNCPATIQEIFDSLSEIIFVLPGSSRDFHGDGSNGNVDVIFANRLLGNDRDISIIEEFIQDFFGGTGKSSGAFFSDSAFTEIGVSSFHTPDGIMGSLRESEATIFPSAVQPDSHCLRPIGGGWITEFCETLSESALSTPEMNSQSAFGHSRFIEPDKFGFIQSKAVFNSRCLNRIAKFGKSLTNNLSRTAKVPGNGTFSHSPFIEFDKITFIERKSTQSSFIHVYNLQTKTGWYCANDIITHNCRHSFYPFFEGISENAYSEETLNDMADKTVNLDGQQIGQYEASQVQRGIERHIRDWKRQAGALEAASLDNAAEVAKVREWQSQMRDFIRQTKLMRQRVREQI